VVIAALIQMRSILMLAKGWIEAGDVVPGRASLRPGQALPAVLATGSIVSGCNCGLQQAATAE
jgi:hypothetical protein